MKLIKLTKGLSTKVDDEDFVELSKLSWHASYKGNKNHCYAISSTKKAMHRLIMRCPKHMVVDHINGDTLDNCKRNLRVVTRRQNNMHRVNPNKNNTSGYRGVTWAKDRKMWVAQTKRNYKQIRIGSFNTAEEASNAYKAYTKQ